MDRKQPEEESALKRNKKKGKENLLLTAKTDNYADEEALYAPRYTKKQRLV